MIKEFWNYSDKEILAELRSSKEGLSLKEVKKRRKLYGSNGLKVRKKWTLLALFIHQWKSPLIILFLIVALMSVLLNETFDSYLIFIILIASTLLSVWQEKGARDVVENLLKMVQIKSLVVREKKEIEIDCDKLVPGDIVILKAGDLVPADCYLFDSKDLYVDESTLTGEPFPVEKKEGKVTKDALISLRNNVLYMGSHVINGYGKAIVVHTGKNSEFGAIIENLKIKPQITDFEKEIQLFGFFLMKITIVLVFCIFCINIYFQRPIVTSLLFALSLAIGLTPQLLPAIISVNLAHGARKMAEKKVIVKKLLSIENFGSMNVLCADKTGTLTEGTMKLDKYVDVEKKISDKTLLYAALTATYQSGYSNPVDKTLASTKQEECKGWQKLDEIPYDFFRKRMTLLLKKEKTTLFITKGSVFSMLEICSKIENNHAIEPIAKYTSEIVRVLKEESHKGRRVIGVAYKETTDTIMETNSEKEFVFLGFIVMEDPIKEDARDLWEKIKKLGVRLKIITGDNQYAAGYLAKKLNLKPSKIILGADLQKLDELALMKKADDADIFAEINPNQKEKIIHALKNRGYCVGFLGDGINDSPALHAADVSISVNTATDIVQETADIILLDRDLSVVVEGVKEGRATFANTLKYMFMATSANFGNMFSMAISSLFLPFLPLLPKQVLFVNLLTDLPEMAIATDKVDEEMVQNPVRMNFSFIKKFMMVFGWISSLFDFCTFGVLLWLFHDKVAQFRTGWFVESILSASLITLVIRTSKPFYKSLPGKWLVYSVFFVGILTLVLPWISIGQIFNLFPLSIEFYMALFAILFGYILLTEIAKRIFYRKLKNGSPSQRFWE